jgi:hypothetical protein
MILLQTTETSPQDDNYIMTRAQAAGYLQIVMKGLQHTSAFVVQFRGASDLRAGQLPGRVEHVASGRTATFQSIEELPQLLRRMLEGAPGGDGNEIG